jgi:3-hydroxyacyl-CoA dehydrogenase/enoyl-CoA hydratase/3-hydroxybutyryl-CoA epimerase
MGAGFPPFRGGVLRYADKLGLQNIVKKLQNFEIKYGERFAVSKLLISMEQNNQKFYD